MTFCINSNSISTTQFHSTIQPRFMAVSLFAIMRNWSYTEESLCFLGSLESYCVSISYQITGLHYTVQEAYGTCAFQEASVKSDSFQIIIVAFHTSEAANYPGLLVWLGKTWVIFTVPLPAAESQEPKPSPILNRILTHLLFNTRKYHKEGKIVNSSLRLSIEFGQRKENVSNFFLPTCSYQDM